MALEIPLESVEPVKVAVSVEGVVPTTGVSFAVMPAGNRPVSGNFVAGTRDSTTGLWSFLVSGLPRGWYDVFVKVDQTPVVPVERVRNVFEVV